MAHAGVQAVYEKNLNRRRCPVSLSKQAILTLSHIIDFVK
jgi:hypothetical protein